MFDLHKMFLYLRYFEALSHRNWQFYSVRCIKTANTSSTGERERERECALHSYISVYLRRIKDVTHERGSESRLTGRFQQDEQHRTSQRITK